MARRVNELHTAYELAIADSRQLRADAVDIRRGSQALIRRAEHLRFGATVDPPDRYQTPSRLGGDGEPSA